MNKIKIMGMLKTSLVAAGCSSFGSSHTDEQMEAYHLSKQFNREKGAFENRRPQLIEKMRERAISWGVFKEWLFAGPDQKPLEKLPEIKPNMDEFLEPSEDLKVIWFGHSTFLLNMDNVIILVDPIFSGNASPISFTVPAFQDPVITMDELPDIDIVLISHDHYDHLDMESIKHFVGKDITFIAPLGVSSHLLGWGISKENIIEKDWWESSSSHGIKFTATPAQHFSGRGLGDDNATLWASWSIQSKNLNVYFSGDSGYDTHFKDIGDRLGPFDIAFLESGQYDERWKEVHMLPEEAVQALKDLRSHRYFPVHWGMFRLAFHTWYDPIERLVKLSHSEDFTLIAPRLGEVLKVNSSYKIDNWWDEVPKEIEQNRDGSL